MALFKILKRGAGSNKALEPGFIYTTNEDGSVTAEITDTVKATEGYAYFDQTTGKFYIDIESAEAVIVGANTTDEPDANRICINPNYSVLNCGTSDISAASGVVYESETLAEVSNLLEDTIQLQTDYITGTV